MSSPRPLEDELLAPAENAIAASMDRLGMTTHEAKLELLEAASALIGGFSLEGYRELCPAPWQVLTQDALDLARPIVEALERCPVPPAMALTALSREPLPHSERRRAGSYYTDFRLAGYLASRIATRMRSESKAIDPAAGTGILLVALALAYCGDDVSARRSFVGNTACAADLSPVALRGVRLSLGSLVDDLDAIEGLNHRLRAGDSLSGGTRLWQDVAPDGFDIVIGNPPWEKLRVTRHEHLAASGVDRHYGDDYDAIGLEALEEARIAMADYLRGLDYELQGHGEADLYRLFLALSCELVADGGEIALLVPAGLIRSDGTRPLRRFLFDRAPRMRLAVLDNKARFFSIDTRFKFIALNATIGTGRPRPIVLEHAAGTPTGVQATGRATIDRADLESIRPDLSLPEVRSEEEWELFLALSRRGVFPDATSPWQLRIVREVDMTNHRPHFDRKRINGALPVIEGRMVHQFRSGAKAYVAGTGRRAEWDPLPIGHDAIRPQFWIDPEDVPEPVRGRIGTPRVGFCDITGQTNERAMLATMIPAGVVCGNKVPTITFAGATQSSEFMARLWVGLANSFVFDWLLRRIMTTTVNYFILRSVPLPPLALDGAPAARIAELVADLDTIQHHGDAQTAAHARAELDAHVMQAYGLEIADAELVLSDFPLLDRGQPPLPGESRSTITHDLVLRYFHELCGLPGERFGRRVAAAEALGATGYIPAQLARRESRRIGRPVS